MNWCNYYAFPHFMSIVKKVCPLDVASFDQSGKESVATGIAWNSSITELENGCVLAWESEPGGLLDHAERVQLKASPIGTRVSVSMCYRPHCGPFSTLAGLKPEQDLVGDLANLKAFIEDRGDRLES